VQIIRREHAFEIGLDACLHGRKQKSDSLITLQVFILLRLEQIGKICNYMLVGLY